MNNNIVIIVLIICTGGSYFLLQNIQNELEQTVKSDTKTILATAYKVRARYFDEKHVLHYNLLSPHVIEYSSHYGTYLDHPSIKVLNNDMSLAWSAQSDMALFSNNKKKLSLSDNIKIKYSPNHNKPIIITGSSIQYDELSNSITSNKPVKINDGNFEQTSKKMILNINKRQLNTQNQVKAVYRAATKL
ncbi:MAG: LPS export ABC transporter periplasmic protein LptC [Gammaproteobacteria bacterium]|nr:LPS export ABC transporter periplasmic protein LptC [Gammaproteobacteria bacterium]